MDAAFHVHPDWFKHRNLQPHPVPVAASINPPSKESHLAVSTHRAA